MLREEGIAILKNRFAAPATFRIELHQDKNGKILSCCQTASALFCSSVKASSDANGVGGVIDFFTSKFDWGCVPCRHFCEYYKYSKHLYCTATMGVGLEALRVCQEFTKGACPFQLVTVELIKVFGKGNVATYKNELATAAKDHPDLAIHKGWLLEEGGYHNVVGIVDGEGRLTVCNYDGKFLFPRENIDDEDSTVAVRISHWQGCVSLARGATPLRQVTWTGLPLTLNQWEDIIPQRLPAALSREDQLAQLARAFAGERQECPCISAQPSFCLTPATATTTESAPAFASMTSADFNGSAGEPTPVLLITGTHMSANPCPGVGVARAVRAAIPDAHIFAADNHTVVDAVFSEARKVEELGNTVTTAGDTKQRQWDIVAGILQELRDRKHPCEDAASQSVFYLPCRDRDIDVAATAKSAIRGKVEDHEDLLATLSKHFGEGPTTAQTEDTEDSDISIAQCMANTGLSAPQLASLSDALLCPVQEVVALTDKPQIRAVTQGPLGHLFRVPAQFPLTSTRDGETFPCSLLEARFFAETHGFPIMVKGPHQGATLCYSWREVCDVLNRAAWVSGGFLQRSVAGWEKCLAFAAHNGELTGACMMTKASYTDVGKVWGGDIESVPSDLLEALKSFAAVTRWTGGGEIEFVEEIVPSTASGIGRWAIDFNPRFPAWIFASTYAGCNLPALLLQQAQQAARDPAARWAHPSLAGGNATRATFVRSVVEVPTAHIEMRRTLPAFVAPTAAASAGKHGAAKPLHPVAKFPVLPQACVDDLDADAACCAQLKAATKQVQYIAEDLHRLIDACTHRLAANPAMIEHSPRFVLNIDSVDVLLKRNKCIMETAIASANASAAGNDRLPLQLQMCLSVKTQPNALVVRAAETSGYLAECIDMAEVYHSVENGGFPFERVVLTGPGKWWDRLSAFERAAQFNHAGPRKLHAVFADSLADLRTIAARLLDPAHSLDADVIGIRWSPVSDRPSRFGLDPQDTEVVRGAAEVIASLPAGRFRLGMHFHHAASFMGGQVWFSLANAYAVFCGEFSALCGQPVSTIDFGGGFDPHFLESEYVARELPALFATVHEHCNRTDRPPAAGPVTVQFELGKSVSEDAGGVLTRIMAVRERRNHKPERESTDSDEGHKEKRTVHALIVDTTVADVSTPNGKAVFLVRFPAPGSPEGAVPRCIPLPAGNTLIWGRTCMEWDLIKGGFTLPADVQEGDLLLIAGCGAYDISMQYDFGDGVGRTKNVIVL